MSNNEKLNSLVNQRNELMSHINSVINSGNSSEIATLGLLSKDVSDLEREISSLENR